MTTLFKGPSNPVQQVAPPKVTEDPTEKEKKKRVGRASLYLTTPAGDLSVANTAMGRLLGN